MTDEGREGVGKLASFLHKLEQKKKTNPLFGQHPAHLIQRYFKNRYGAMSDADMMMKFLAERIAVKSGPTTRNTLTAPSTSRTEQILASRKSCCVIVSQKTWVLIQTPLACLTYC